MICDPSKEKCADLSNRDEAFLNVAIEVAKTSTCRQKHGAVIVVGGSVYAVGTNRDRNHPAVLGSTVSVGLYTSYHAEQVAIQRLNHGVLSRATLYVARVNNKGEPMFSRPCSKCVKQLIEHGIKEFIYTT